MIIIVHRAIQKKKQKFIYFNEDENEYYSFDDNSTDIVKI